MPGAAITNRYHEDVISVQDYLSSNPQVCGGEVGVSGTRIPVTVVLDSLAEGSTREGILESCPSLRPEDIDTVLYPKESEGKRLLRHNAVGNTKMRVRPKRKPSQSVKRDIQKMVRRIVRQFHPERVILFGSHARGDAGPDSDVDLLVVMPVPGSKREKQIEIRAALRSVRVPVDVILSTPEEFGWRQEIVGTIEYPAVREGKVLYAQS